MTAIDSDVTFKSALEGLDAASQRQLAVRFVQHVLPLCQDARVARAVAAGGRLSASSGELENALKSVRAASVELHTRCGSDGDWAEQAGYFVARAAAAALSPAEQATVRNPAWQAALSSRMARTCATIAEQETGETSAHGESEWQYRALGDYLNSNRNPS